MRATASRSRGRTTRSATSPSSGTAGKETPTGPGGNGVTITGQNNSVGHVAFFGNGGKAIANGPGANGGIAPPQNLRIGPRRPDGSLPLTGTSAAGTVELWSGNPSGGSEPGLVDAF